MSLVKSPWDECLGLRAPAHTPLLVSGSVPSWPQKTAHVKANPCVTWQGPPRVSLPPREGHSRTGVQVPKLGSPWRASPSVTVSPPSFLGPGPWQLECPLCWEEAGPENWRLNKPNLRGLLPSLPSFQCPGLDGPQSPYSHCLLPSP